MTRDGKGWQEREKPDEHRCRLPKVLTFRRPGDVWICRVCDAAYVVKVGINGALLLSRRIPDDWEPPDMGFNYDTRS